MTGHKKSATAEDIIFNGEIFRREPHHKDRHRRVYYMSTTSRKYLHRAVWEQANGRLTPAGHHIHHINGNPLDNSPENLEAIPEFEHLSHHGKNHPITPIECGRCGEVFFSHRSWGRWCSSRCKEAQRRADGVAYVKPLKGPFLDDRSCEECNAEYVAKRPWARFCSSACKQRAGRRLAA